MSSPVFSCVITAHSEGEIARSSVESLINQSFGDFEIIMVQDGATEKTKEAIRGISDNRLRIISQTNDGPSSARNRALHHCRGKYVCFLDADDSRPAWALKSVFDLIESSNPDIIFTPGTLSELRGEILDFYDTRIFEKIKMVLNGANHISSDDRKFYEVFSFLTLIEPQSANKFISLDMIRKFKIAFPNNIDVGEDMLFHISTITNARKICFADQPCFTYHRRYSHPQLTASTNLKRFHAIAAANISLEYFSKSYRFSNTSARFAYLNMIFKTLKWCEYNIDHTHRYHFNKMIQYLAQTMHIYYVNSFRDGSDRFPIIKELIDTSVSKYIEAALGDRM